MAKGKAACGARKSGDRELKQAKRARNKEFKTVRKEINKHLSDIGKKAAKEKVQIKRALTNLRIELAAVQKKSADYELVAKRMVRKCNTVRKIIAASELPDAQKKSGAKKIQSVQESSKRMMQDYKSATDVMQRNAESLDRHRTRLDELDQKIQETTRAFMQTLDTLCNDPTKKLEQAAVNIFKMDGVNGMFMRSIMPERDPNERRGYMVASGREPRYSDRQKRETPQIGFLIDSHSQHFFTLLMNQRQANRVANGDQAPADE